MAVLWKCVDTIVAKCAKACVGCVELCQNLWWLWYEMCGYWYLYSCLTTVFSSTNGLASKYSLSKSVLALLRCSPIPGLVLLTLYQNQLWPHNSSPMPGLASSPIPGLALDSTPIPGLDLQTLPTTLTTPRGGLVSSMPIWPYTILHQTLDWYLQCQYMACTSLRQTQIGLVYLQCQYGLTQVFTKPGLVFKSSMPIAMALHKSLNWSCASSMPIWPYTPSPNLDWPCVCSIRGLKQTVLHYIGLRSFEHLQCYW